MTPETANKLIASSTDHWQDVARMAASNSSTFNQKSRILTPKTMYKLRHNPIRRRRNQLVGQDSGPPLLTKNRFSSLENDPSMNWAEDNFNVNPQNSNPTTTKSNAQKPPPIKITDNRFNASIIKSLMTKLNIVLYQTKNISIGIKVEMDEKEDFEKLREKLIDDKIDFFTHRNKDQKEFKIVLSGLPRIETGIIVDELRKSNITPTSVTELTSKNANPNFCLYLVQFAKNDVTLAQLKKIRAIDHVIVNWKPFVPRNKGPTQCRNCSMLGHGAQNCHRTPACMFCASTTHIAADCQFNENNTETTFIFKCFNCSARKLPNINHKANDPRCPCRSEYLEIRNKMNHRNIINHNKHNNKAPHMNQDNFPSLRKNADDATPMKFSGPTFADQFKRNANEELYSMDDLFEIFQDAVEDLMACSNKGQQMKVLFKLLSNAFK